MAQFRYPHFNYDANGNASYKVGGNGDQIYPPIEDSGGDLKKIFIFKNGVPVYAKKLNGDEYYPAPALSADITARGSDDEYFYAKDANQKEIYPKHRSGKDMALQYKNHFPIYAKDKDGKEFYPRLKNRQSDEYVVGEYYIYTTDRRVIYPLSRRGVPLYPIDKETGDEIYFINKYGILTIGVDKWGNERYAKKTNNDEYYPPNMEYAKFKNGQPRYAVTGNGKVIFPVVEGEEEYLMDPKTNCDVIELEPRKLIDRYAKNKKLDEYYPSCVTDPSTGVRRDIIVNRKYAKLHNGTVIYPRDEYGNEFVNDIPANGVRDVNAHFPVGYPITNDNWIIVPGKGDVPYIVNSLVPLIQQKDITNKIYRSATNSYPDFKTNVSSRRQSYAALKKYPILPLNAPQPTHQPPKPAPQPPRNASNRPRAAQPAIPVVKPQIPVLKPPQKNKTWLTALILFLAGLLIVAISVLFKKYWGG